jgi:hypothetical protein
MMQVCYGEREVARVKENTGCFDTDRVHRVLHACGGDVDVAVEQLIEAMANDPDPHDPAASHTVPEEDRNAHSPTPESTEAITTRHRLCPAGSSGVKGNDDVADAAVKEEADIATPISILAGEKACEEAELSSNLTQTPVKEAGLHHKEVEGKEYDSVSAPSAERSAHREPGGSSEKVQAGAGLGSRTFLLSKTAEGGERSTAAQQRAVFYSTEEPATPYSSESTAIVENQLSGQLRLRSNASIDAMSAATDDPRAVDSKENAPRGPSGKGDNFVDCLRHKNDDAPPSTSSARNTLQNETDCHVCAPVRHENGSTLDGKQLSSSACGTASACDSHIDDCACGLKNDTATRAAHDDVQTNSLRANGASKYVDAIGAAAKIVDILKGPQTDLLVDSICQDAAGMHPAGLEGAAHNYVAKERSLPARCKQAEGGVSADGLSSSRCPMQRKAPNTAGSKLGGVAADVESRGIVELATENDVNTAGKRKPAQDGQCGESGASTEHRLETTTPGGSAEHGQRKQSTKTEVEGKAKVRAAQKRPSNNKLCPCGSGHKYKQCCKSKEQHQSRKQGDPGGGRKAPNLRTAAVLAALHLQVLDI